MASIHKWESNEPRIRKVFTIKGFIDQPINFFQVSSGNRAAHTILCSDIIGIEFHLHVCGVLLGKIEIWILGAC